jgi:hypothetical protein
LTGGVAPSADELALADLTASAQSFLETSFRASAAADARVEGAAELLDVAARAGPLDEATRMPYLDALQRAQQAHFVLRRAYMELEYYDNGRSLKRAAAGPVTRPSALATSAKKARQRDDKESKLILHLKVLLFF